MKQIFITQNRKAELLDTELDESRFGPNCVGGPTLYSLISSGTEVSGIYQNPQNRPYPIAVGYSAVFQADYIGGGVTDIKKGDILFCCGFHASYQLHDRAHVIKLQQGTNPVQALFARIAGVSMATLSRTEAHAGDQVLVAGMGGVGLMGMQAYRACGYEVIGIEPDARRAEFARRLTALPVYESFSEIPSDAAGLALECSGTQQAALECCRCLRKGGELSLVGVPWKKTGDITAYELLNEIFFKYLNVYSGWEMNLPMNALDFHPDSQMGNFRLALRMITEGEIKTDRIYKIYPAFNADSTYAAISDKKEQSISVIHDWTQCV